MNDEDLITRYIELNPHRPALDEARLKNYGVAVWALIGYLPAVGNDVSQVAHDYGVSVEAVEAAIAYYKLHRPLIDARIAANSAEYDNLLHPA